MPGNVVLIGFSGSGKSSVAKILARQLRWRLIDTDQQIVERYGMSIAQLFREQGERAFRRAESDAVALACAGTRAVISVGGGAPVDLENRARLKEENLVVRLDAPAEVLLARLRSSPNAEERPMLAGDDPLGRIRRLLVERRDAYAIADLVVETSDRFPEDVASEIARRVSELVYLEGDES